MSQQDQGRYVPPHRYNNPPIGFQQSNSSKGYDDNDCQRRTEYSKQRRETKDNRRPEYSNQRRETKDDRLPKYSNQRRETKDDRPEYSNQRRETRDNRPEYSNQRRETRDNRRPEYSNQRRETKDDRRPEYSNQRRETRDDRRNVNTSERDRPEYSNQRRETRDDRRNVNTSERDRRSYEPGKSREGMEVPRNRRRDFSQGSKFNTRTISSEQEYDQKKIEPGPIEIPEMIIPPVVFSPKVTTGVTNVAGPEMAIEEKESENVSVEKSGLPQYEIDLIRKLSVIRTKLVKRHKRILMNGLNIMRFGTYV